MAQQTINTGTANNDGTGDTIRAAGTKINANFTEVYGDIATLQTTTTGLVNANHISNVVEDTTPQLGGNLDTNGNNITGTGDINLANGDTGFVFDTSTGYATFNSDGSAALTFQNPAFPTGVAQNFFVGSFGSLTLQAVGGGSISLQPQGGLQLDYSIWPTADGTTGQVLTTNGSGALSWTDKSAVVDLTGYATESWVNSQGFLVAGDVAGEIDLTGYATIAYVDQEVANVAFADIQSTPTTLTGYGITDAATSTQGSNADTAFGWGNHADAGYLTSETDSQTLTWTQANTTIDISSGNQITLTGMATEQYVTDQLATLVDNDGQTLTWDQANVALTISGGNTVELTDVATQTWVNAQGFGTGSGTSLADDPAPTLNTDLNANTHSIDNVEFVGGIDGQQMFINAGGANVNPTSGENLIMIGWNTTVTGYFGLDLNIPDAASGTINIGTTSINQKWPKLTQQPGAGKVLRTADAAGTLEWADQPDVTGLASESYVNTAVANVGIDDLVDVTTHNAQVGSVLKYNGTNWVVGTDDTGSGGSSTLAGLTDVNTNNAVQGSILAYNNSNSTWEVNTSATSSIIAPVALGAIDGTSGTGTGLSWSNWDAVAGTLDITFTTAQPDTAYAVITDGEFQDDGRMVSVQSKTTAGFEISLYDGNGNVSTPSSSNRFTILVYSATPTVNVFGSGSPALNDISDLTVSSVSDGDVISYADGSWANRPLDVSGVNIADLANVDPLTPSNGDVLTWDTSGTAAWKPVAPAATYGNSDVDTHLNTSTATTGQILSWTGTDYDWVDDQTGGSATVAGANTQIQFNNSGALGASTDLTFNDTTNTLTTGRVEADAFASTGTGTPTITSSTDIELIATNRVKVTTGFFRLPRLSNADVTSMTPTEGDMYYNTDDHSVKVYAGDPASGGPTWQTLTT